MVVDADTDVRDLVRAQLVKKAEGQGLPSKGKLSKRAQKKARIVPWLPDLCTPILLLNMIHL